MDDYDFLVGVRTGSNNRKGYSLYAKGEIDKHGKLEDDDTLEFRYKATGRVTRGNVDLWEVKGWIAGVNADDGVTYLIDGETGVESDLLEYRPARFGDDPESNPKPEPEPSSTPSASDAGCPDDVGYSPQTRTSGQKTRHGIEFDRTVHAVEDLGWTADGTVNALPETDGTLIEVPDGEFVVGRTVLSAPRNWGIVGLGENAVLRAPVSKTVRMIQVSGNHLGENILLENITFDQRDGNQAGIQLSLNVHDGLHVENCRRVGTTPNRHTAGPPYGYEPNGITASIRDPDGSGLIVRWTDHCETQVAGYPLNAQGIFCGWSSKGTLTLRESSIKNQGEHATYCSKASAFRAERCELLDNANTNLRIAGEGSYAEDCTIGYSRDAAYTDHHDGPGRKATKLVRMEHSREHGVVGGRLTRCDLVCETDGLADMKMLYVMGNVGGVLVEDSVIRNDSDGQTVVVDAEGTGWRGYDIPGDTSVVFDGCRFEGSSRSPPVENHRHGAISLDSCEVDMPNAAESSGL